MCNDDIPLMTQFNKLAIESVVTCPETPWASTSATEDPKTAWTLAWSARAGWKTSWYNTCRVTEAIHIPGAFSMCENTVSGVTASKITCCATDDASFGWCSWQYGKPLGMISCYSSLGGTGGGDGTAVSIDSENNEHA